MRVTIWNEFWHERNTPEVGSIYPEGIHAVLAKALAESGRSVRTATFEQPEHGIPDAVLAETDVLVWWAHRLHDQVSDAAVKRVQRQVLGGMGLVMLHSGHFSKVFKTLMGATCALRWRDVGERERIWVVSPSHPIAQGLPAYFELEQEEAYGEFFDIPEPDELVLISWFKGGEVFRSGCCFTRGRGRIFYFRPGHETFPTLHDPNVQKVIVNAARWAALADRSRRTPESERVDPLERL